MLSRTADHLYWMARYMERAENTARMLDVNYQASLLPQSTDEAVKGWKGLLSISELTNHYAKEHGDVNALEVMRYMVSDEANPYPYFYDYGAPWYPAAAVAPAPLASSQSWTNVPVPPEPIFYPRTGQNEAQVEGDRRECNRWATTQQNAMADASIFHRATLACMDGRGYSSR